MERATQLVKALEREQWDLGSIPRSPHNSHIIFFKAFLCRFSNDEHHKPHPRASQVSTDADPKAQKARAPCSGVNSAPLNPRSQTS